ncbi:MAG: hypothetical protein K5874_06820 [Bacteroidaceae bacterium]|nr:hypothetical protein [Bacteroidaceae bacterium]
MKKLSPSDKLIFVNIKNSYEAFKQNNKKNSLYRNSVYDCTRMYWRINEKKASEATHILGCYKGKVIEVIKINDYSIVPSGEYEGRIIFDGIEEVDSHYMNLNLYEVFDTLANFRTKYWNL